jgi:hypothetical protein
MITVEVLVAHEGLGYHGLRHCRRADLCLFRGRDHGQRRPYRQRPGRPAAHDRHGNHRPRSRHDIPDLRPADAGTTLRKHRQRRVRGRAFRRSSAAGRGRSPEGELRAGRDDIDASGTIVALATMQQTRTACPKGSRSKARPPMTGPGSRCPSKRRRKLSSVYTPMTAGTSGSRCRMRNCATTSRRPGWIPACPAPTFPSRSQLTPRRANCP